MSDEASAMNHQPDYQEPTPDDLRTAIDKFEDLSTAEECYNLFFDISENLEANGQPEMGRLANYVGERYADRNMFAYPDTMDLKDTVFDYYRWKHDGTMPETENMDDAIKCMQYLPAEETEFRNAMLEQIKVLHETATAR